MVGTYCIKRHKGKNDEFYLKIVKQGHHKEGDAPQVVKK